MAPQTSNLRGAVLGLGGFGLYSLYDVTTKYLGHDYSPAQILFFAGLFAMPMVLAKVFRDPAGGGLRPVLPRWTMLRVVVALFNGVLGAYAFTVLPLAESYAIFFLMPLMISLVAVPMLGEPLDLRRGLAIVAGLAGVIIVLRPGEFPILPGHLAAFVSAALGAVNYIILRKTGGIERAGVLMFWPMLVQLVVVALALPFVWQPMPVWHVGLTALMALELFAGGMLVIAAYRNAPVIVVAPMQYSQIIWAALLGAILFSDAVDSKTVVGIMVIVASGLYLLSRTGADTHEAAV